MNLNTIPQEAPQLSLFAGQLPLVQIVPSRWQPRNGFETDSLLELAESIQSNGLWNPVLIFYNEDGEPELVAGERRVRASVAFALATKSPRWIAEHGDKLSVAVAHVAVHGWKTLAPDLQQDIGQSQIAVHDMTGVDVKKLHQIAVAENIQRESLSLLEESRALQDLQTEHGYSQRDLARVMGKSQGWVQQRLAIGSASKQVQELVNTRVFTIAHVRALGSLPAAIQDALARTAQKTIESEGDSPATTRKIEKLAKDARALLDAEAWEPEATDPLAPKVRNGRILIAHLVRSSTTDKHAAVIGKLGAWGSLSARPQGAGETDLAAVLAAWSENQGRLALLAQVWTELAPGAGFECGTCLWQQVHVENLPGEEAPHHYGCPHLAGEEVKTCLSYVRDGDDRWPQLVEVPWTIIRHLPDREHPEAKKVGISYLASPAGFVAVCRAAAEAQAQRARQETRDEESTSHALEQHDASSSVQSSLVPVAAPSRPRADTPAQKSSTSPKTINTEPIAPEPPSTVLVVRIVGNDPDIANRPVLVSVGGNNGKPDLASGTYADLQEIVQAALDRCLATTDEQHEATEELILAEV